jgi:hypothetical protein
MGALGCNPQTLIDTLVLSNGDDVYTFIARALDVEKTIAIGKLQPSPNALFEQSLNQLCKSTSHQAALADIKLSFVDHIKGNTINSVYKKHTLKSIQQRLMHIDAPMIASIPATSAITPSMNRNMLPSSVGLLEQKPSALASGDGEDDELEMLSSDGQLRLASLRPAYRSGKGRHKQQQFSQQQFSQQQHSQQQQQQHSQQQRHQPRSALRSEPRYQAEAVDGNATKPCGLCGKKGHHHDQCERRGEAFWSESWAKQVAQFNAVHGTKPARKNEREAPPPPNAHFPKDASKLRNHSINTSSADVEDALKASFAYLDENISDEMDGQKLMVSALSVRKEQEAAQPRGASANDDASVASNASGSVFAIGSATSEETEHDDLSVYSERVNCEASVEGNPTSC